MADQAARREAPPSAEDKRSSPRLAVALPVLIGTWDGQHRARIHNISRGGALVEAAVPVHAGSMVQFQCGTIETPGTVVWQNDNCFGVSFRLPVDDTRIAQQVARSEAVAKHRQNRQDGEG